MSISAATLEDLRAVSELHVASWRAAYRELLPAEYLAALSVERREGAWRQVLSEGRSELLVERSAEGVRGFVSFGPSRDADAPAGRGEIWALYVQPEYWSAGVGRELWLAAQARLRELGCSSISLWVIVGNERALRFYRTAGFRAEPGSEKQFEIGGTTQREIRLVVEHES